MTTMTTMTHLRSSALGWGKNAAFRSFTTGNLIDQPPAETLARAAGAKGTHTQPLTTTTRITNYLTQTRRQKLTPRQRRRTLQKDHQPKTKG